MGEEWNSRRIPRVLESLDVLELYPHVILSIMLTGGVYPFLAFDGGLLLASHPLIYIHRYMDGSANNRLSMTGTVARLDS